jgi:undecaprenyl-diphosphatase
MLIEALKALLFGIVEGITEWLPISSTGHLMLLNQLMPLDVSASFYDTFLVVIQLGAIMAVIILYFHKLNPFSSKKTREEKRTTWNIWGKVVVGSIPAAIVGFGLDSWMEENVMNNSSIAYIVVAMALLVYGIIFIIIEQVNRRRLARAQESPMGKHAKPRVTVEGDPDDEYANDPSNAISKVTNFDELSYGRAFLIGIFQSLAVIPGTSRSGSTIIGSMLLGTSRTVATEFAFFLAIPIMFGWSLLKLIKHGLAFTQMEWMVFIIGILTAFIMSVVSIRFLMNYIKRNDFTAFGVYRIILAIVVLVYFGGFVNHVFF